MNRQLTTSLLLVAILLLSAWVVPQLRGQGTAPSEQGAPAFEVASVKPRGRTFLGNQAAQRYMVPRVQSDRAGTHGGSRRDDRNDRDVPIYRRGSTFDIMWSQLLCAKGEWAFGSSSRR